MLETPARSPAARTLAPLLFRSAPIFCAGVLLVSLQLGACSASDPDKQPSEVLSRFLEALDRSAHEESALKDAFALLDERSQAELTARSERTSSLAGRNFAPWEMIAPGRFRMLLLPKERAGMRATTHGDTATVQVKAADGRAADVPLVFEHGRWRVKLDLPAIAQRKTDTP